MKFLVQVPAVGGPMTQVLLDESDVFAWLDGFLTAVGRRDLIDVGQAGRRRRRTARIAALRRADAAGVLVFVEIRGGVG